MMRTVTVFEAEPGTSVFGDDTERTYTDPSERKPSATFEVFHEDPEHARAIVLRELVRRRMLRAGREHLPTVSLTTDGHLSVTLPAPTE